MHPVRLLHSIENGRLFETYTNTSYSEFYRKHDAQFPHLYIPKQRRINAASSVSLF